MVNQSQFGYSAGYYHYCVHLVDAGHTITYIGNDQHLKKVELNGVRTIHIDEPKSIKWRLKFKEVIDSVVREEKYDVALLASFKGFSCLLGSFGNVPVIANVRTGDISKNSIKRKLYNWLIRFESNRCNYIITLSDSLAKKLHLNKNKCDIVPLGSDVICDKDKNYEKLNILYVGSLNQRNIYLTVEGVAIFKKKYPQADVNYDIIGYGAEYEVQTLTQSIERNNLGGFVSFHGQKNYKELEPYFNYANVGVAFVPMTPYYDCQPSTKIFEYALSGIYSLATNTYENKLIISSKNGILHQDTADAFAEALERYYLMKRTSLNATEIRRTMADYEWGNIVAKKLIPILTMVSKQKK